MTPLFQVHGIDAAEKRGAQIDHFEKLRRGLARRPFKVVAIALANKMARIAWALLASGGHYEALAGLIERIVKGDGAKVVSIGERR
jgi:hypothetical protein